MWSGVLPPFFKALMLWMAFYVVIMHVMVAWKWTTPTPVDLEQTVTTPLMHPAEAEIQAEQEVVTVYEYEVYDLHEETIQRLQRKVAAFATTVALVESKREELAKARERILALMESTDLENATSIGGGMILRGRGDLSQFLRLVPLFKDKTWLTKYRSNGSLRQVFFRVRRDLQDSKRLVSRNWSDANRQLSAFNKNDTLIDWSYLAPNCGVMTDDNHLAQQIRQAAQQDIQQLVIGVQTAIQERVLRDQLNEWCISLPTTYDRLETYFDTVVENGSSLVEKSMSDLNETLHNFTERVQSLNESVIALADAALNETTVYSTPHLTSCVQTSQVLAWIQAGLDAHYRKRDIREALMEALGEDPKVENVSAIILDAVLPLDDLSAIRRNQSHLHHRRQSQLRSLLDTPLTKEVAKWIDMFVDRVGGYNDRVDQWMDAWNTYALSTLSASADIGDDTPTPTMGFLTVQALLQAAGKLNEKYMSYSSHLRS